MLTLAGLGFRPSTPATDPGALGGFGQGIWAIVSSLASLFAGGWVAGRLAGLPRDLDGAPRASSGGGLATLLRLHLLTSGVGRVVSGVTGLMGAVAAGFGSTTGSPDPLPADAVRRRG